MALTVAFSVLLSLLFWYGANGLTESVENLLYSKSGAIEEEKSLGENISEAGYRYSREGGLVQDTEVKCNHDFNSPLRESDPISCLENGLYGDRGYWRCTSNCDDREANITGTSQWAWQVACPQCNLNYASQKSLCLIMSKLNRRRVVIVGDSVQGHLAEDFASVFGAQRNKSSNKPFPYDLVWDITKCKGLKVTVTFLRDDLMQSSYVANVTRWQIWRSAIARHRRVNLDWVNMKSVYDPQHDVLIFSTGLHHENRTRFEEIVSEFSYKLQAHNNTFPVIFRRSVGGHPHCERFKKPISASDSDSIWDKVMSDERSKRMFADRFRWNQQHSMNQYVVETLRRLEVPFLDIDVEEATKGRFDAHKGNDCLHFLGASRSVYKTWVHMINTYLVAKIS